MFLCRVAPLDKVVGCDKHGLRIASLPGQKNISPAFSHKVDLAHPAKRENRDIASLRKILIEISHYRDTVAGVASACDLHAGSVTAKHKWPTDNPVLE